MDDPKPGNFQESLTNGPNQQELRNHIRIVADTEV